MSALVAAPSEAGPDDALELVRPAALSRPGKPLLSIVVPVYNEEDNVGPFYEAVSKVMAGLADRYDWEFVFTDNHSEDRTFVRLRAIAARDPRVRVFRFSRNFGFQRSILTGYTKARGDAAVQLDCDLQDPPSMIADFLREWEAGYKIVYGVRTARKEGWFITLQRRIFYRVIDVLSEDRLPLDAGDFRLVDRQVLDELITLEDDRPYLRGTLAVMGFAQKGLPYVRAGRTAGESKFSTKALFSLAFDGILSHSIVPLRMATYTGLVVSLITLLLIVYFVVARIAFGQDWPRGYASSTIFTLLALSLNALFLGVIGEYVGRIYNQVRRRATTIIERSIDPTAATTGAGSDDADQRAGGDVGARGRASERPASQLDQGAS